MKTRILKVEPTGDFFHQRVKPALRLKGRWLEQAGFPPNTHARIIVRTPGVLEIQAVSHVA